MEQFDAVVLDIMLPKVNGYDVCRRLREAGALDAVFAAFVPRGDFTRG